MDVELEKQEPLAREREEESLGVILEDPDSADLLAVARAMAAALEIHPADAARRARYCRGVVVQGTEADVARRLIAALDQGGIAAFTVPGGSFADLPEERRMIGADLDDEAILAATPTGPVWVPWTGIAALAACVLLEPGEIRAERGYLHAIKERIFRPGLVRVLDEMQVKREKGIETRIRATLICEDPGILLQVERDCRIRSRTTQIFAEGPCDEEGIHSLERYLRLLLEIILRSGAYVPERTEAFVRDVQLRPITLTHEEERRNSNLWLWQMLRSGRLEGRG